MTDILQRICKADKEQIDYLLDAVMQRMRELYPEWEIVYYARKRGDEDSLETLLAVLGREE